MGWSRIKRLRGSYARFNLNLTAGEKPPFETLFSYFPYWKTIAVTMLLQAVYILLWTLLLIIPGIMASYSYAMTGYILAEHPELTAGEAIAQSKAMMARASFSTPRTAEKTGTRSAVRLRAQFLDCFSLVSRRESFWGAAKRTPAS